MSKEQKENHESSRRGVHECRVKKVLLSPGHVWATDKAYNG